MSWQPSSCQEERQGDSGTRDEPQRDVRTQDEPQKDLRIPESLSKTKKTPLNSSPTLNSPTGARNCKTLETLGGDLSQSEGSASAAGFKSSQELAEFWSPSVAFGQKTPGELSRQLSRTSTLSHGLHASNLSSPISDSNTSSTQHTPGLMGSGPVFTFKNYSPTASVDEESLLNRQMTQSAIQTPSHLDDSFSSAQFDPLSQSMRTESSHRSSASSRGTSSPVRVPESVRRRDGQLNQSLKVKFERIIGIFSPKRKSEIVTQSGDSEEFAEIFISDLQHAEMKATQHSTSSRRASGEAEVGEECLVSNGDSSTGHWRTAADLSREKEVEISSSGEEGQFESHGDDLHACEDEAVTPCVSSSQPGEPKLLELTL